MTYPMDSTCRSNVLLIHEDSVMFQSCQTYIPLMIKFCRIKYVMYDHEILFNEVLRRHLIMSEVLSYYFLEMIIHVFHLKIPYITIFML